MFSHVVDFHFHYLIYHPIFPHEVIAIGDQMKHAFEILDKMMEKWKHLG